jgi:hypothetical protein
VRNYLLGSESEDKQKIEEPKVGIPQAPETNIPLENQPGSSFPKGFFFSKELTAKGGGDCFFDSVAQGMNNLVIPGRDKFSVGIKQLRQDCFDYTSKNQDSIDEQTGKTCWREIIAKNATAGGYQISGIGTEQAD